MNIDPIFAFVVALFAGAVVTNLYLLDRRVRQLFRTIEMQQKIIERLIDCQKSDNGSIRGLAKSIEPFIGKPPDWYSSDNGGGRA